MPMTTCVRPEAGHLLGFLERHLAVVDDRGDVRDGARLHVRQALALAAGALDVAVPVAVDLEDERLGELRADVERGAAQPATALSGRVAGSRRQKATLGGRASRVVARRIEHVGQRLADGLQRARQPIATRAAGLGHLAAGRRPCRR